jgi:[acyl-carrier-protein] S-malonyltransferase
MKYRDFSRECLDGYEHEVAEFLARASDIVRIDARKFNKPGDFFLDDRLQDDLQDQYVCYIDNCTLGRLLKRRISCDFVAGYSMGLFAALYHGGAVSFEDGLRLLQHTCAFVHDATVGGDYGMGAVVGFTPEEIGTLIVKNCPRVEMADICGPHVVIASGTRSDLKVLLQACEDDGALNTKMLPVLAPFHSSLLRQVEAGIREVLAGMDIRSPACGIVSCIDQKVLRTAEDVREEAAGNVSRQMNWLGTMNRLLELGVDVFLECGLSESLCNLARNIEGNYKIYHPRKFKKLFASAA